MPSIYETARIIRATPKRLFKAWLDSEECSAMTGEASTIRFGEGDPFSAADGLITGRTLEVEPYNRIVQAWNTEESGGRGFQSWVKIAFVTSPNWGGLPGSPTDGATIKIRHEGLTPEQRLFSPQ